MASHHTPEQVAEIARRALKKYTGVDPSDVTFEVGDRFVLIRDLPNTGGAYEELKSLAERHEIGNYTSNPEGETFEYRL